MGWCPYPPALFKGPIYPYLGNGHFFLVNFSFLLKIILVFAELDSFQNALATLFSLVLRPLRQGECTSGGLHVWRNELSVNRRV